MTDKPCCTPLRHLAPETLAALNADLRAGGPTNSVRKVADRYGLGRTAVSDHRACLGLRSASDGPRTGDADDAGQGSATRATYADSEETSGRTANSKIAEARSVLEQTRRLTRRSKSLLRRVELGEEGIDFKAASSLVGQIKAALELEAKLLGEIKAASTTVNVYNSPDWHRLRDLLVEALAPHPDALGAVIGVLEREQRNGAAALH